MSKPIAFPFDPTAGHSVATSFANTPASTSTSALTPSSTSAIPSVPASGILRITHDIKDVETGGDLSIAVAYKDSDITHVRALIQGPVDSPYEFGFFEFDVKFGKDYPTKPPEVKCITTNGGITRFNPNIYAEGKVCLSIIGTWRGERGEQWSSAQGLSSILWSIQSLMSSNPYDNEPGFESRDPKQRNSTERVEYRSKIHHETLRISVIRRLEDYFGLKGPDDIPVTKNKKKIVFGDPFEDDELPEEWRPFIDLCKRRFLWYYDSYKRGIADARQTLGDSVKDGRKFPMAPFESGCNGMAGSYGYTALDKRLDNIQSALEEEALSWERAGRQCVARESPVALSWSNTFKNISARFQNRDLPVELQLEDKLNPLVWKLTIFGGAMTNLEGAIINVKIVFHEDFPKVWPRVISETPLFHHLISQRGSICYVPKQEDDIQSHIYAIFNAIQDESPRYDPRMRANPEASRLLWGTPEEKKIYNRRLRRSAQDSLDNC